GGAACGACPEGTYRDKSGGCEAVGGEPLSHDFPAVTSTPGQEQLGQCRSWTVGNDDDLWVNAVELVQDEDSHHSNWVFVPEDQFDGPDGIWGCGDRGYDFYLAVAAGGLLYSQ